MKLLGINFGKRKQSIVDVEGNPISSENILENPSKRDFVKGAAALSGIALAGAHLFPGEVQAASRSDLTRVYNMNTPPPGATPELCQDEILRKAFVHMLNDGSQIEAMRTIIGRENKNSQSYSIDYKSWYCEPLVYMALNTYKNKSSNELLLDNTVTSHLKKHFYHNFALMNGTRSFYEEHVFPKRKRNWSFKLDTEKWLIENIFASAEVYPGRDNTKAQKYLDGDFLERTQLITELGDTLSKMSWSNSDKLDTDFSGTTGKGPLNNWYRLLSAQWGAFLLANHYWTLSKKKNDSNHKLMKNIYNNVEEPLIKSQKSVRGPPFYINKKV